MSDFLRSAPPARQPAPPELPMDRTYTVVGSREVNGKVKGEQVVMCLTGAQEAALIEAGHIEPVMEKAEPLITTKKPGKQA